MRPSRPPVAASPSELFREYLREREAARAPDVEELCARAGASWSELRRRIDVYESLHELSELLPAETSGEVECPLTLGRYHIRELLGHGGLSRVYLADDPVLGRQVALKVLERRPGLIAKQRAYTLNEARSLAHLDHPGVVRIFEVGNVDGSDYIAIERVQGSSLAYVIDELRERAHGKADDEPAAEGNPLAEPDDEPRTHALALARDLVPFSARARLMAQVARALAYCHDRGVLHRDVKPANILLEAGARPRLIDFGLAHLESEFDSDTDITQELIGTAAYVSPEQVERGCTGSDPASDQFSLGIVLYELLTLRNPFQRQGRGATLDAIAQAAPEAPRAIDPAIPRDLERIALHCLARDARARYPSVAALADDLEAFLGNRAISLGAPSPTDVLLRFSRRHRRGLAAVGSAVALAALLWLGLLWRERLAVAGVLELHLAQPLDTPSQLEQGFERLNALDDDVARKSQGLLGRALYGELEQRVEAAVRAWSRRLSEAAAAAEAEAERAGIRLRWAPWQNLMVLDRVLCPSCPYNVVNRRRGQAFLPADVAPERVRLSVSAALRDATFVAVELPWSSWLNEGQYRIDVVDDGRVTRTLDFRMGDAWSDPLELELRAPDPALLARMRALAGCTLRFAGMRPGEPELGPLEVPPFYITERALSWDDIAAFLAAHPGRIPLDDYAAIPGSEPARVIYSEAEDFASWVGARLPTLTELHVARAAGVIELSPEELGLEGEWTSTPSFFGSDSRSPLIYAQYEPGTPPARWTNLAPPDVRFVAMGAIGKKHPPGERRRDHGIGFRLAFSGDPPAPR